MKRIEVNVQTGEVKVIELTAEEIADAQARTLAEQQRKAAEKAKIEAARQKLLALGLTVEDLRTALRE